MERDEPKLDSRPPRTPDIVNRRVRHAVPPPIAGTPVADLSTPFGSVVLLVDDEPEILEALRWALRKEPFDILSATSARDALAVLERTHVDVVVSDDRMPGMPGSQLLAIVRRTYPRVARIVLTGSLSLDAAARAISEGEAHAFLTKPCDITTLAPMIHDILSSSREAGARASEDASSDLQVVPPTQPLANALVSSPIGSPAPEDRVESDIGR